MKHLSNRGRTGGPSFYRDEVEADRVIAVLFALLMVVTYGPIVPMGLMELFYR